MEQTKTKICCGVLIILGLLYQPVAVAFGAGFFSNLSKNIPSTGQVLGESVGTAHAAGQNFVTADGTIYVIDKSGQRRPYTSAGAFLSYSFNTWQGVVPATTGDTALQANGFVSPRDGSIICSDRGTDKGTCYVISQQTKIGFPSQEVFLAQGYSFQNTLSGDVSFLQTKTPLASGSDAHALGSWISWNGTDYVVTGQGLSAVTSPAVLESWGVTFKDVVPATSGDKVLPITFPLDSRLPGELNPLADDSAVTPASVDFSKLQTTPGAADFIITDVSVSPSNPVAGQPILMTFSIKNIGQAAGTRPRYTFFYTPNAKSSTLANYSCARDTVLQPTQTCTDSWQLIFDQPGAVEIDFVANTGDENGVYMPESDYNNNKLAYNFTVGPATGASSVQFSVTGNPGVEVGQFYEGTITVKATLADLNVNYLDFSITSGSLPQGMFAAAQCNPQTPRATNDLICAIIIGGNAGQAGNFPLQITGTAPTGETGSTSLSINIATSTNASNTTTPFSLDYPKGGEQLQHGQSVVLSWTGGNANTVVGFSLLRQWMPGGIPFPASPDPFISVAAKNTTATGGSYTWTINPSLPAGQYLIFACLSNTTNTSICLASQGINIPVTVGAASTQTPYRDQQRLQDIGLTATALELYFNDRNTYPDTLAALVPGYLKTLPVAPSPADGSCSDSQNTYNYSKIDSSNYSFGFCLGGNTQSFTAGPHTLSPAGIK